MDLGHIKFYKTYKDESLTVASLVGAQNQMI